MWAAGIGSAGGKALVDFKQNQFASRPGNVKVVGPWLNTTRWRSHVAQASRDAKATRSIDADSAAH